MTAGRREFGGENRTAAGGDSDLHRNGKSWKLGKKNLPFRRTPESLREIPIYIGMEGSFPAAFSFSLSGDKVIFSEMTN